MHEVTARTLIIPVQPSLYSRQGVAFSNNGRKPRLSNPPKSHPSSSAPERSLNNLEPAPLRSGRLEDSGYGHRPSVPPDDHPGPHKAQRDDVFGVRIAGKPEKSVLAGLRGSDSAMGITKKV